MNLKRAFSLLSIALWGLSEAAAQPSQGTILWTHDVGTPVQSSPARGPDGTIYVATVTGLYAVTNAGSLVSNKGVFPMSISSSAPAVDNGGTVYICSADGNVYALDPMGAKKWSYSVNGSEGSAAIDSDGTVYVEGAGYLYALTPAGGLKWRTLVGAGSPYKSPIISSDGTIYVGTAYTALSALNRDGTKKWQRDLSAATGDSPALGPNAEVYISGSFLFAFDTYGTELWRVGSFAGSSPSVGLGGTVYAVDFGTKDLFSLSPQGQVNWEVSSWPNDFRLPTTTPALDKGGNVYYCASNSVLAFGSTGVGLWSVGLAPGPINPSPDTAITSPIIGPDGILYAALGTKLFAIATGTNGPADSPWPMYRGNAQHTGRIQKPSLQNPKKRADANFEFELFSQTGTSVSIESTTNLTTWNTMTSVVPTTAPEPIVDLTASNSPAKFYRAKGGG